MSRFSSIAKKTVNILSALLLLITFILVIIMMITRIQGKTPQLFGYQILRISSSSMAPTLEVGDIIVSRRADPETIKSGDILTYNGEYGSYKGKLITHMVVAEPYEAGGKLYFSTMGIANDYVDPEISQDQIVGKMICKSEFLSTVYAFFITPFGLITVLCILGLLLISELFAFKKTKT